MPTMAVIRDADGKIINVGPWDYQTVLDENENPVATNPLPYGAYEDTADVEPGSTGGLYPVGEAT